MNILPRRILVAVDFGQASARAVTLAGELASRTGAALSLLHAESFDVPPYFTPAQVRVIESEERANAKRASDYLVKFGRRLTTQPFAALIESRVAANAILHASKQADLIVMGTHGRRGPSRWWLGSVAERVLQETDIPLLVVHDDAAVPSPEPAFARGLLLAGGAVATDRTTRLAAEIAERMSGTVTAVTGDEEPASAKARLGATWVAAPVPVPMTPAWRSHVGARLLQSCALPVLFVPEADGGPSHDR